jgi:hypothetical protein
MRYIRQAEDRVDMVDHSTYKAVNFDTGVATMGKLCGGLDHQPQPDGGIEGIDDEYIGWTFSGLGCEMGVSVGMTQMGGDEDDNNFLIFHPQQSIGSLKCFD